MSGFVSVLFGTRNRDDFLVNSIRSLDVQEGISPEEYEMVVVDDGSTDGTGEKVAALKTRVPLFYHRQDWSGVSVARNRAVREARGDIIVFVDDDVLAPPGFLAEHRKCFAGGADVLVRGPIVVVREPEMPRGFRPTMANYDRLAFCGCNASLLRATFWRLGGFDENFDEYGYEDNEFGWRLAQAGIKTEFVLGAYIFHHKPVEGRETGEDLERMIKRAEAMGRMGWKYYKKHPHWKVKMAVGLHPLTLHYSRALNNGLVAGAARKWIEDGRTGGNPALHHFLSKRIFQHHYLKSILQAKEQDR